MDIHELKNSLEKNNECVENSNFAQNNLNETHHTIKTCVDENSGIHDLNYYENTVQYLGNIILLVFEDDIMRPVLKINDEYMAIIEKWYKNCDLLIDIEKTNVSIPEYVMPQDISGVLFQDINYKFKNDYLIDYIPIVLNNIISNHKIINLEKKFFMDKTNDHNSLSNSDVSVNQDSFCSLQNLKLNNIGVIIPENINPYLKKKESKTSVDDFEICPFNVKSKSYYSPFFIALTSDDKRNYKKEPECNKQIEIQPYNTIHTIVNFDKPIKDSKYIDIPMPYTEEFNCLNPNFSENCNILIENYDTKNTQTKSETCYVLINDRFLKTLTIRNPDQYVDYILKNHTEFGFIKLFDYETTNIEIINFIEREFYNIKFNDVKEINKKLLLTSQYIEFLTKQDDSNMLEISEEIQVKKFINDNYTITDNVTDKMKASVLHDIIVNSKVLNIDSNKIAGFKTRLSKYLKELGLQKKRYNDGFYYYGIIGKRIQFTGNLHHNIIDEFNKLKKKREEENQEFIFNTKNNFSF